MMYDLQGMHGSAPLEMAGSGSLSTGAAARVAGCHPVTIWRAIKRGELRAIRIGEHGHHRIDPDALAHLLRQRPEDTR